MQLWAECLDEEPAAPRREGALKKAGQLRHLTGSHEPASLFRCPNSCSFFLDLPIGTGPHPLSLLQPHCVTLGHAVYPPGPVSIAFSSLKAPMA